MSTGGIRLLGVGEEVEGVVEVLGVLRGELDVLAGAGVGEAEALRVQPLAGEAEARGERRVRAVREVADLYDHTGVPYLPLRDGQALVINGDDRELV